MTRERGLGSWGGHSSIHLSRWPPPEVSIVSGQRSVSLGLSTTHWPVAGEDFCYSTYYSYFYSILLFFCCCFCCLFSFLLPDRGSFILFCFFAHKYNDEEFSYLELAGWRWMELGCSWLMKRFVIELATWSENPTSCWWSSMTYFESVAICLIQTATITVT